MKIAAALLLAALFAQDGQQTRPVAKNSRGLLPVNRSFYDLAASTGGDFYIWAPGEFATSKLDIPLPADEVALAYGTIAGTRTFEVPVESGVRELVVFVAMQRKDLVVIVRPDGSVARNGIQSFQNMTIAKLAAPASGIWKIEVHGEGMFSFSAHVRTANDTGAIGFDTFRFVEPGGRPGHEGMFPLKRNVRRHEELECEAEVSGAIRDVEYAFVARDGELISSFAPPRCDVPGVPFRVVARGHDRGGKLFQRITRGLVAPD